MSDFLRNVEGRRKYIEDCFRKILHCQLCLVQHCWIVIVGRLVSSIVDTRLVLNLWNCEERCFYDNREKSDVMRTSCKNVCNFIKMFEKNCICLFVLPERQGMGRKEFLRFVPCSLYPQLFRDDFRRLMITSAHKRLHTSYDDNGGLRSCMLF